MLKQTPTKDVEGSDQLQFEVEHETLQPEKSKETSSKTVQEDIVHEIQDEQLMGQNPIVWQEIGKKDKSNLPRDMAKLR